MGRTMGDAIHVNVAALHAAGLPMVAGYVTGGGDIEWTPADWALFAGIPSVTIDQGYTGSPVLTADVRDVEKGAWTAAAAVNRNGWTAARPTIYCSESVLPQLEQAGWRGDVWVALYDGVPELNFQVPPGMTCVAKQYTDTGGGGAYDLSAVFDPAWPLTDPPPQEDDMSAFIVYDPDNNAYLIDGGKTHKITSTADLNIYLKAGITNADAGRISAAEIAALLADFPAGNPAVTVGTVTVPDMTITGTVTPA